MPYHVRITPTARKNQRPDIVTLDKSRFWILDNIAEPRRQGRDIFIEGRVISWDDIDRIQIFETDEDVKDALFLGDAAEHLERSGDDVTEEFLTGPPGTGPRPEPEEATTFAANRKAVMVIYGHDAQANTALFDWLRAIGLLPQEWSQLIRASGSASPYVGQVLDQAFRDAQAVIAFFTPDEHVTAATSPDRQRTWRVQARPNVLIEAGMALITHPTRTVIVVLGNQELPSDLAGRHYIRLNNTAVEPLHDLAERLHTAGCDTDTTGTAWLNPGRFPNRDHPPQWPTTTATPPATSKPTNAPPAERQTPDSTDIRRLPAPVTHTSYREHPEAVATEEPPPGPAFTKLWRATSDGFAASPAGNMVNTSMPGYTGSLNQFPFVRFGFCVACDPLAPGASSSKIGTRFVAFLNREPAISLVSALTHISQATPWIRLAGNGALRLDAMLHTESEDARPNASAMLLPLHEGMGHYGRDDRFACLWLHIEPRTPDGTTAHPAGLPQWHQHLTRAIDLGTAFAGFLADEIDLTTRDEPAARVGVMLQAPNSIYELVDPDELKVLPDAIQSNQFLAYTIADPTGKPDNGTARDLLTVLCDHTMHLTDFEQVIATL